MGATFPAADGLWVCAGVIVESCHKRVRRAGLPTAGCSSCPLQGASNDGSVQDPLSDGFSPRKSLLNAALKRCFFLPPWAVPWHSEEPSCLHRRRENTDP